MAPSWLRVSPSFYGFAAMSKPYTSHDNIVRVIQCHKIGLSTKEIVEQTGIKCRTIQNLVAKFKAGCSKDLPVHKGGGGKKKIISPRSLHAFKRYLDTEPSTTANQLKEKYPLLLEKASIRTVQRSLHNDLNFKKVKRRKKPLLTPRHMEFLCKN